MGLIIQGARAGDASSRQDQKYEFQRPVSSKLNRTGRRISMPVPFKDENRSLGELVILLEPDDTVLIPKAALVTALTPLLDAQSLQKLHGLSPTSGQLTLGELAAAGFAIKFDPAALELVFLPNPDQRPTGQLSMGNRTRNGVPSTVVKPAFVAGYVNLFTGADHIWNDGRQDESSSLRFDAESVLRVGPVVFENDFLYDGLVDSVICPIGANCSYEHREGFKRRRSRIVYDIPEQQIRIQAGDADVFATSFQRAPDVLGIAVEKSPRKLRPGESIRPSGRSSFRLERTSDVEVLVNGAIVQRFRLRAGNYNLSDLPLATGANEVQLIITDDTGNRRSLTFTTYFDATLLGKGKTEWSVAAGVPSYFRDNERHYRDDEAFITGFVRYGLSDRITAEVHAQGDSHVQMAGAGMFSATRLGFFGLQGAVSESPTGTGAAINVNWDLINYAGPFSYFGFGKETLRLGAEWRSSDFRTPGEYLVTASGIYFPQYNYWLRLTGAYSVPLTKTVTMTIGGRYQFADDAQLVLSPNTLKGDRFGADVTFSSPLAPWASGSLTVGYSNETYLFTDTRKDDQADLRVMARLYLRPTDDTRITTSYDTLTREAHVSGYRSVGRGIDRWDTSVDVLQSSRTDNTNITASANYFGNRAEVRAVHSGGFEDLSFGAFNPNSVNQRTSVVVGTALAFADGKAAIGPPIRGNGFAIVSAHESIADKTISVGTPDDVRAKSDFLGPALVTNIPAYSTVTMPIDVADLPIGYSLGSGALETYAPYHAGYRMEVGSAYSVSVFGTLARGDGSPVSLLTGVAFPVDQPDKQVALFTNRSGKFGADGLAPGKWIIQMATEDTPTRFELEVPAGTKGLFKAGTLKPSEGG